MIIQSKETKAQSTLIDLLGGNAKNSSTSKSNDLFSKLLSSFGLQAKSGVATGDTDNDFKTIIDPKNKALNSTLKSGEIKSSVVKELQSLLSGSDEKESTLISKELVGTLSSDQVRTLINRAKEYLKNEITTKAPEYQTDTKNLPKTLLGLIQLADKLGLEPQSFSLSTLMNDNKEGLEFSPELLTQSLFNTKTLAALPIETTRETPFEAISQLLSEIKGKEQKNTKSSTTDALVNQDVNKSESQHLKALLQNMDKTATTSSAVEATVTKDVKILPFTSLPSKEESLLTLLQGKTESTDSKSENASALKVDTDSMKAMHTLKTDSIEVKSKEAQQSMRLFASDLKEAVQEYKPPFTRLTMKLNPEKLGEVEVTLVQRGNNVHVNIQSNNTTSVAFLAHNATELKAQLAQQGITNATMNFMSGGENQQQSNTQNQHQHEQRQNAFRSYESFEELTLNEEQLSALEIIIPHYA